MSSLLQRERTADALIRFVMYMDLSLSRGEGNRATWSQHFYIQYEGGNILYFCLFTGLRSVLLLIKE